MTALGQPSPRPGFFVLRASHGLPTTRFLLPSFKKYSAWSRCFPFHAACSLEGFALPHAGWPAHSSLIYVNESRSVTSNFATPWTTEFMEFSRPEYWSGLPCHPSGELPNPGIKPRSPALQVDSLPAELPCK